MTTKSKKFRFASRPSGPQRDSLGSVEKNVRTTKTPAKRRAKLLVVLWSSYFSLKLLREKKIRKEACNTRHARTHIKSMGRFLRTRGPDKQNTTFPVSQASQKINFCGPGPKRSKTDLKNENQNYQNRNFQNVIIRFVRREVHSNAVGNFAIGNR
jgi:hypothetical protein